MIHDEYQVKMIGSRQYKRVSALTHDEAKDQVCRLIDILERIQNVADSLFIDLEEAFGR